MEQPRTGTGFKLGTLNNGRLGSLSLPRDLTLGGTRTNKKIFKPNLNVVRNKDKAKESVAKPQKKFEKKQFQRTQNNKKNNNQLGRFIQSTSVFSEGGADIAPRLRSDRYLSHRDHEVAAAMEKPAIVKSNWNIDKKAEEAVINDLLADDECSSSEEDVQYMPVLLPLKINKLGFKKNFSIKKELKFEIKKEPYDTTGTSELVNSDESNSNSVKFQSESVVNPLKEETPTSLFFNGVKKFNDDDLNISLIKMPDSLPGRGFSPDSNIPTDLTLDQMVEGQIGKIFIRKSGKVEVMIGNTKYNLEAEEPPDFLEEVMVLPDKSTVSKEPKAVHLTSITDRLVMSPSWEHLFLQGRFKKKSS